ncbi:hypothetical protein AMTR_s00002p00239510 [Amborella trichopoda]|uniref:Galectin domain-containing protein n=1 Tax=Amborella trichopoda TaxID=13333 RepID=W1NZX7_AMBTC|nr:hypothetical protein AMTR_s00002p00239510 [Amborella trichopoda]
MKKAKFADLGLPIKSKFLQALFIAGVLYLFFMSVEVPLLFNAEHSSEGIDEISDPLRAPQLLLSHPLDTTLRQRLEDNKVAPLRPARDRILQASLQPSTDRKIRSFGVISMLPLDSMNRSSGVSELQRSANDARRIGKKVWREVENHKVEDSSERKEISRERKEEESCPHSISLTGFEFESKNRKVLLLPCGLTLGSHITLVGRPHKAHEENDPKISTLKDGSKSLMVSQFMLELQGLKAVDGEDPPRILHLNPRLKGDWSGKPVIEQNTCYRMQWGSALRCEGWKSRADEETVDVQVKCEKWIRDDDDHSEESKTTWWLNRLIGRTKKVTIDWPYPFAEEKLFVLTLSSGLEGYHVNVDGRHVTSFPYRTGFVLEDATGLSLNGDIDVHSIFAASLPTTHPSFSPQRHLEMSSRWQAPLLPEGPVDLFIGILSAGNHFAERMAVRKSWMQSRVIRSSRVVARFFVALHGRKEVNIELKKEAEYFGDIIIVPFMDSYDLVVRALSAKYIMKCDDDTFVRVNSVIKEVKKVPSDRSLYIGNMNYYHKPLRVGKWAVTYEEWLEEDYPPYANGPGYVVSADIAEFITSEFEKQTLRLFKMEDVSMGMWVEQFNSSRPVEYVHDFKYCQFGCIDDYFTAHYQSPRQMLCMWNKLQSGKAQCCNMR